MISIVSPGVSGLGLRYCGPCPTNSRPRASNAIAQGFRTNGSRATISTLKPGGTDGSTAAGSAAKARARSRRPTMQMRVIMRNIFSPHAGRPLAGAAGTKGGHHHASFRQPSLARVRRPPDYDHAQRVNESADDAHPRVVAARPRHECTGTEDAGGGCKTARVVRDTRAG